MKQISETPTGNSDLKDGVSMVVDDEVRDCRTERIG